MTTLMKKIKKKIPVKIQSASISYLGMSLELGLKKKISHEHLRELYVIRNTLSYFYFLYQHKYELIENPFDDEQNNLIDLAKEVFSTYKKLADVLLGSEYFSLIEFNIRDRILQSFDYVNIQDAYLDAHPDNDLSEEKIIPMVEGLLTMFEEITEAIQEQEKSLN
ncbi:hypothetical protein RCG17_22990 [Neobacillus sp. PS3-12]|uniref:hypothetical protein n=1 Tax=Neobacillus sp. PS3-12 TaxID=3070677 RepID=UPI0027E133BF|nr:hypothetical protein [Neobacillus sp. PS3-12]WML52225.1 hypothetical protein RCG17_22990 [Neobacillus sp. PS3-12]